MNNPAEPSSENATSEIVSKKPADENGAIFRDRILDDLDHISGAVEDLQRGNWVTHASFTKLLKRLMQARLLYWLASFRMFSARRRARFLKSAEKRDPMLLARRVDQFCVSFSRTLAKNEELATARSDMRRGGLTVTAVVPNYNHAKFLRKRLDSIIEQTYPLIDIIILDDNSNDASREVIESYVDRFPGRIKAYFNDENSGNVFRQWKNGHRKATGDIIWICESDDFCEPTFVERCISSFRDASVMLAFGKIQYADEAGSFVPGLDNYREDCEAGVWGAKIARPASDWFSGSFAIKNIIPNVGGSLWRNFYIPDEVWDEASQYTSMGDWYLYSIIAMGGQIVYEPSAVSYFRIHGNNTSGHKAQSTAKYYREYNRLMTHLKRKWEIPDRALERFIESCSEIFRHSSVSGISFSDLVNSKELKQVKREDIHVLIGILGFSYGGGEIFPIHLANALRSKGTTVSILQMHDTDDKQAVRRMLDPAIPVYSANYVRDIGVDSFVRKAGVSVIHSHIATVDAFLLDGSNFSLPYMSTLHGSYEAMEIPARKVARWSKRIDVFAYLAERNLIPFQRIPPGTSEFVKVRNAMPVDQVLFKSTREDLSISKTAVVFCFVARGVAGKGWVEAVKAYLILREKYPDRDLALLMAGDGPSADQAKEIGAIDPTIHMLGFVSEIHSLYRMSDVALIPTRFPGESFPLCLIQALQVGVPCVATDIGEIKNMCCEDGINAGLLVDNTSDDNQFVSSIVRAMEIVLNDDVRFALSNNAALLGEKYDMEVLAEYYANYYRKILR